MKAKSINNQENEALTLSSHKHAEPVLKRIQKKSGYIGIGYAIMSSFLISIQFIFIKKANYLSGSEISIIRYIIQLITMTIIAKCKGESIFGPKEQRLALTSRGIFGAIGMLSIMFAVKLIAPSDAISLMRSNIIITAIFARFFLTEKFTLAHIVSVILTIAGIFMISQPEFLFGKRAFKTAQNLTYFTNFTQDSNETMYFKQTS